MEFQFVTDEFAQWTFGCVLHEHWVLSSHRTTTKIGLFLFECVPYSVSGQSTIRWCAISAQEMTKCNAMAQAFNSVAIRPTIQCVSDASVEGCAQKIGVSGALSDK